MTAVNQDERIHSENDRLIGVITERDVGVARRQRSKCQDPRGIVAGEATIAS